MVPILPVPKWYAWGSYDRLQTMFGAAGTAGDGPIDVGAMTGEPLAEMWFSAHGQRSMTSDVLVGSARRGTRRMPLADLLRGDPGPMLGETASRHWGPTLPYLLKVIAVRMPLSLQVHPLDFEARRGFHREQSAGIPQDDPARSFRDMQGKHEMVVALEPFDASVGFAPVSRQIRALRSVRHPLARAMADILQSGSMTGPADRSAAGTAEPTMAVIDRMMPESARVWSETSRRVFRAFALAVMYGRDVDTVTVLREAVSRLGDDAGQVARNGTGLPTGSSSGSRSGLCSGASAASETSRMLANALRAAEAFPGDASALCLLMMNPVRLREGESVSIPPGTPHVYIHGLAAEIMTNSDNVLRAGLTVKHRDVPNLLRSLNTAPVPPVVPYTVRDGERRGGGTQGSVRRDPHRGLTLYHPCIDEFSLTYGHVEDDRVADWPLPVLAQDRPRIVVCVDGSLCCETERSDDVRRMTLRRGEGVFVPADDGLLRVAGVGNSTGVGGGSESIGHQKTGGSLLMASTGI
ncbi:type I phosphomannose isomerase catalytic subunit [Bifidobacterium simiarum]|uniref:type I phosphomannose isomerase catalytic subunit n=1 Tax=Bifidobacterium simiarum TaxID=2045441 RepID=UPI001BDDC238|nr:type I phosphomannose isomerase catalytic subunit [Bifidobacterium simiarum]MBT1167214.1 class I mannose-6-phosphate isomerase [Bifidobacterium simiarum]